MAFYQSPLLVIPTQAETDDKLVAMWLHGRSSATTRAYKGDALAFLAHAGKPIRAVTVGDLHGFSDTLTGLSSATQARRLSAVKSLLTYAHRLGYVTFNVGAAVKLPSIKATLAERIMGEADVQRMLVLEPTPRNAMMLRLIYAAGLRISEVCGLAWRDLQPRDEAGQATVYGKGGKTRAVLLPASVWRGLMQFKGEAGPDVPVFVSGKGGHLDPSAVHRVVKLAAARAGLSTEVSCHFLRHAHASHALDRGAPIHLVQATLGHVSITTTGRYLHARPSDSSARYLAV